MSDKSKTKTPVGPIARPTNLPDDAWTTIARVLGSMSNCPTLEPYRDEECDEYDR